MSEPADPSKKLKILLAEHYDGGNALPRRQPFGEDPVIPALRARIATLEAELATARKGNSECIDDDGTPFASARVWRAAFASERRNIDALNGHLANESRLHDDACRQMGKYLQQSKVFLRERDAARAELARVRGEAIEECARVADERCHPKVCHQDAASRIRALASQPTPAAPTASHAPCGALNVDGVPCTWPLGHTNHQWHANGDKRWTWTPPAPFVTCPHGTPAPLVCPDCQPTSAEGQLEPRAAEQFEDVKESAARTPTSGEPGKTGKP